MREGQAPKLGEGIKRDIWQEWGKGNEAAAGTILLWGGPENES